MVNRHLVFDNNRDNVSEVTLKETFLNTPFNCVIWIISYFIPRQEWLSQGLGLREPNWVLLRIPFISC